MLDVPVAEIGLQGARVVAGSIEGKGRLGTRFGTIRRWDLVAAAAAD